MERRAPEDWPYGYVDVETPGSKSRGQARRQGRRRQPRRRVEGVALVMVMTVVAIMTIFIAEMLQNTTTAFHVSVGERDKVKAEYLAKSGLNLTRLLIANEPNIRRIFGTPYQMVFKRRPPQLNVWSFADDIFAPFSDPEAAKERSTGIDFGQMEGLKKTGGTFEITAIPENSMINLSKPLFLYGNKAKQSIAMQLYALMGGYQSPNSPYDVMFSQRDPDGNFTSRLDIVSAMIDWWDSDEQRLVFDPGASAVASAGSEDNAYAQFPEPYTVKNAPYDSLEELRLVRGVGEDFWANFIENDPEDPRSRRVTIYGSGSVNPNEARPEVLLARLCSFVVDQPLCQDGLQAQAFIMLFNMARGFLRVAVFSSANDFLNFVEGKGGAKDIYPMLLGFLGPDNPLLLWTPVVIPQDSRKQIASAFITSAAIFTIQSVGRVGKAKSTMKAVINFDPRWVPPPGVSAKPPKLGVFHHYRLD